MATLNQRITALEQSVIPQKDRIDTIIWNIVYPKVAVQPEPIGARTYKDDWRLSREQGETADDFLERAKASVPRNELGFAAIVLEYPEEAEGKRW